MPAVTLETDLMEDMPQIASQRPKLRVLVVDQDAAIRTACVDIAESLGYAVESAPDLSQVRSMLARQGADILVLDLPLHGGQDLLRVSEIRALFPRVSLIAMAPFDSASAAQEAFHCGASDYLNKPFTVEEFKEALERASTRRLADTDARRLLERLRRGEGLGAMVGRSPEMEKLYRLISKVAPSTHPVLILGESGTGKELVARTIHECGPNASHPFLPVDCGSLVPTLIESELFGYVKGAFTGASHAKDGLLVAAGSGTVFLDEIGELTLDLQAKLLRALQEKEVRPVGATHRIPVKARILTATNRNLATMVETGAFRKDLYYRLNVVNLRLPPLRDRREDIPLLVAHFLEKIGRKHPGKFSIDDLALRAMMRYSWPGNVRELENAVEHAVTMVSGGELQLGDLPTELQQEGLAALHPNDASAAPGDPVTSEVIPLAEMERAAILETIRKLHGDKLKAAKLLGIGKTTLYRKLKEYGIEDPMRDESRAPAHHPGPGNDAIRTAESREICSYPNE